jgi:hypothetical protein
MQEEAAKVLDELLNPIVLETKNNPVAPFR